MKKIILAICVCIGLQAQNDNIERRTIDTTHKIEILKLKKPSLQSANSRKTIKGARTSAIESDNTHNYALTININFENYGIKTKLSDSVYLWQLAIANPEIKKMELMFKDFNLTRGSYLQISDKNGKVWDNFIGSDSSYREIEFSSALHTDTVYLKLYFNPLKMNNLFIHSINNFRYISSSCVGSPGIVSSCNENINCSLGNNWQNEKRGTILMLNLQTNNTNNVTFCESSCSASLLNNESPNFPITNLKKTWKPLVYTATHCFMPFFDVITESSYSQQISNINNKLNTTRFYFNYETNCNNTNIDEYFLDKRENYILGARLVGFSQFNSAKDNILIEMNEKPDLTMRPFYNGWNLNNDNEGESISIHHPLGDLKKITSLSSGNIIIQGNIQPGSSGGPVFNVTNKLIYGNNSYIPGSCIGSGCPSECIIINKLSDFKNNFRYPISSNTTLQNILSPVSNSTMMDGDNFCPQNKKFFKAGTIPYSYNGNYNKQIAGEFEFTNVDMSGARVDFQATNKIHIHANEGNFRIKPYQGNISIQAPNFYPNYFRLRAIACDANQNSARKENVGILFNKSQNLKLIKNYFPNPTLYNYNLEFYKVDLYQVLIYNLQGVLTYSFHINNALSCNFGENINSGTYFVKVSNKDEFDIFTIVKL